MNSYPSPCNLSIFVPALQAAGAEAYGAVKAEPVAAADRERFAGWRDAGHHASMEYLTRYDDVRFDPRNLLEGARSLIVCLFNYRHDPPAAGTTAAAIAAYAHGDDYHDVLRSRLQPVTETITNLTGGACRICVDTAPLMERTWARRARLGFIGANGLLTAPGRGAAYFIATIITTAEITDDTQHDSGLLDRCEQACLSCRRCADACPVGAIDPERRTVDSRRCLSYLTIEHRGPFDTATGLHGHLYGCDDCINACPHHKGAKPTSISNFELRPALGQLTFDRIANLTPETFARIFKGSAIKRAKLAGLLRNLERLHPGEENRKPGNGNL